ncbi:MAG: hypothetical protein ACRD4I_00805 [Candidatus Angelobacter sp.]
MATALVTQGTPAPLLDLTNVPVRHRLREPVTASGSGHVVGYQVGLRPQPPVSLQVRSLNKSDSPGMAVAELEIRNTSRRHLEIPVDPSSRDLEPASASTPYRYVSAYLWLLAEPKAEQKMPATGLHLYGSRTVSGTLRDLGPGEAIRIRAKIPIADVWQNESSKNAAMSRVPTMRAFLAFFDESMTPTKDGLQSSTEEIFPTVSSANLAAYPL